MQVLAQDRQANYPRDDTLSTGKCTNHRLTQMGVSVDYIQISGLVVTSDTSMVLYSVSLLSRWSDRITNDKYRDNPVES